MPVDYHPAPTRGFTRQDKLALLGYVLAVLGMVVATWTLVNCVVIFEDQDHPIAGQMVPSLSSPDHAWDVARRVSP
jgi:hypothetical protein